jgi:hypothetical protein
MNSMRGGVPRFRTGKVQTCLLSLPRYLDQDYARSGVRRVVGVAFFQCLADYFLILDAWHLAHP